MNFNTYQQLASQTALYTKITKKHKIPNFLYPALGLAGESGEVLEKIKKLLRDANLEITDEFRETLKKELGDVLWYLSELARQFGISLEDVAKTNIEKLKDRQKRNKLHGEGDNR